MRRDTIEVELVKDMRRHGRELLSKGGGMRRSMGIVDSECKSYRV